MSDSCGQTSCDVEKLQARQSKTLKLVLGINLGMFVVEFAAGIMARSTALLGDSLDMLGDALVYGFSLYVVSRNDAWKAGSAFIKGLIMAFFGVFVLGAAVYHLLYPEIPQFETIGLIGLLALAANGVCVYWCCGNIVRKISICAPCGCALETILSPMFPFWLPPSESGRPIRNGPTFLWASVLPRCSSVPPFMS